jgi:hypothetical protein
MRGKTARDNRVVRHRVTRWFREILATMGHEDATAEVVEIALMLVRGPHPGGHVDFEALARGPALLAVHAVLGPDAMPGFKRRAFARTQPDFDADESGVREPWQDPEQVLLEALTEVVQPRMSARLIDQALELTGLGRVPVGVEAFCAFIDEGFLVAARQGLGAEAASILRERLAPVLARAHDVSGVRRRRPSSDRIDLESKATIVLAGSGLAMETLAGHLASRGHDVVSASTGSEIVVACKRARTALVVCRADLAGINALHLAALMRRIHGDDMPHMVVVGAPTDLVLYDGLVQVLDASVDAGTLWRTVQRALAQGVQSLPKLWHEPGSSESGSSESGSSESGSSESGSSEPGSSESGSSESGS